MLGRGVLSRLHCLTQQDSYTLSVYLDVDQNKQSNRYRGYVTQAEAMLKDLRARCSEDSLLEKACEQALEEIRNTTVEGRAALVVVHPESGLCELHTAQVNLPAQVHWRRGAFLRPIVEAMDEHETYAVVLTDSQRARLFSVYLGEISEYEDLLSEKKTRTRALGADQWNSQKRRERQYEEAVTVHAKRVIDALHDLALHRPFDRLIVAGPTKATAQLARLLPRRLRGKLVENVSIPVNASKKEVLQGILEVQQKMEREQEVALVEGVVAELHEGGKAVSGLDPVVDAVNQGRVWKLVYTKGFTAEGGECRDCGCLTSKATGLCSNCQAGLQMAPGFVDRLAQGVLDTGGGVEVVDGAAATTLSAHGCIAAVMRY